jgi:hypothetical protein
MAAGVTPVLHVVSEQQQPKKKTGSRSKQRRQPNKRGEKKKIPLKKIFFPFLDVYNLPQSHNWCRQREKINGSFSSFSFLFYV